MMMVRVARLCRKFHTAVYFVAMFSSRFQFKGDMTNAMLPQFLSNTFFDFVGSCIRHNVHSGIVILTVHAPNMNMVHIQNPL